MEVCDLKKRNWSQARNPGSYAPTWLCSSATNRVSLSTHPPIQRLASLLDWPLPPSDLLVDIQSKVGDGVRNVLSDALDPRLLSILQEQLHPVRTMLSESSQREEQRHQALISKIEDQLSTVHLEYSATQLISGQQHSAVVSEMREREEKFIQGVHALKDHISTITKTIQSKEFTQRIMSKWYISSSRQ